MAAWLGGCHRWVRELLRLAVNAGDHTPGVQRGDFRGLPTCARVPRSSYTMLSPAQSRLCYEGV